MTTLQHSQPSFSGIIGVATGDITPPVGIYSRNWGAAAHDVADDVHRPFTATALTLQAQRDDLPLVLVALDLGWWRTPEDEWVVRGALLEALGSDASRVMINLSHTHGGPSLCRDDADKPGGQYIKAYLEQVRDTVIRLAREALATARPATLDWHYGQCALAQNRDLPDPQADRLVCGWNPDVPADDTLLVGRVTDENNTCLASIVNYACHPTTLAWQCRSLSPDYPATMREVVEKQTGAPCLFLQGASGELAPRDQYTGDVSLAESHGRQLGYAVLSTLEDMLAPLIDWRYEGALESGAPLALWKPAPATPSTQLEAQLIDVELPLKEMPTASEIESQMRDCKDRVLGERLRRKLYIRREVGDGDSTVVPTWVWHVGDVILIGQRNEAYSQLQRELRTVFPKLAIVVMNLVNGSTGYLPPADRYDDDLYAVWQTPFASGSLERLIAAVLSRIVQ
jgi:hypothetical protein